MTREEMQRTMEFIVERQAEFEVEIQKLVESQRELRDSQAKLVESRKELRESQGTLTAALLRVPEIVEELAESQKATKERLRQTNDQLNALITVVKPHVTGPGQ